MSSPPPASGSDEEEDLVEAIRRSLADLAGLGVAGPEPQQAAPRSCASPGPCEPCPEPQPAAPRSCASPGTAAAGSSGGQCASAHTGGTSINLNFRFDLGCGRRARPTGEPSEAPPAVDGKPPCSAGGGLPTPPPVGEAGLHGYVVWANPADPAVRGVHYGGARAWRFIEARLSGRQYRYADGVRLRRFDAGQNGFELYYSEAVRHRAPISAPVFRH